MRIGMILDSSRGFPPDIRVEKEAKALSAAGHEVHILTTLHPQQEAYEYVDTLGSHISRIKLPANSRWTRFMRAACMREIHWESPIEHFVRTNEIEILHVHDLLMVPSSLSIAKQLNLPLVADLHENMPAAMRSYRSSYSIPRRVYAALRHNYLLMRFHEKAALRECTHVIVVVPEAKQRLLRYGVSESAISVISNTEDEQTFSIDESLVDPTVLAEYRDRWTLSYIGGMGAHRGIDTALKGFATIANKYPDMLFVIVGATGSFREELVDEAKLLGVSKQVRVTGWQPSKSVGAYILSSKVCLVPHNDHEHTQTTIPHKLFQYMICGKPVLVSDCAPLKRVVEQSNCGRVFRASDESSFAEQLEWMYQNSSTLNCFGAAGRESATGPFSWKHDASRLVACYQNLASNAPGS